MNRLSNKLQKNNAINDKIKGLLYCTVFCHKRTVADGNIEKLIIKHCTKKIKRSVKRTLFSCGMSAWVKPREKNDSFIILDMFQTTRSSLLACAHGVWVCQSGRARGFRL